jgi:adenylyltransferase/sulfurtransferase
MDDPTLLRYSRQIMLAELGIEGQQRLRDGHALIIGVGGLGSPASMYLAAAGVGTLTLVDDDDVDLSNLQRQVAHTTGRIGMSKTESAAIALTALNPDTTIHRQAQRLHGKALRDAVAAADVVVDCSDNFATRFALNAASQALRTPLVSGAAIRWDGQISVFTGQPGGPCYRCLYPREGEEDLRCSENGVVAPLVGIIGTMQALEAIKLIAGVGESLGGRLLVLDGLRMQWRELRLRADPACPVCGR